MPAVPGLDSVLGRLLADAVLVDDWRAALDLVLERARPGRGHARRRPPRRHRPVERSVATRRAAVTQAALDEAARPGDDCRGRARAEARAHRRESPVPRSVRHGAAEVRRAAAEERRAVLAARLGEVESRLQRRDPTAQATAEHQPDATARTRRPVRGARRGGSPTIGGRSTRLHDRLRERRRVEAEAARARRPSQLDVLRARAHRSRAQLAGGHASSCPACEIDDAESAGEARDRDRARCAPSSTSSRLRHSTRRAPEVPEGTTLAGRARELERDLRLMGPINPLALEEHRGAPGAARVPPGAARRREATAGESCNRVIRAVDKEIVTVFEQAFSDVAEHFAAPLLDAVPRWCRAGCRCWIPTTCSSTGIEIEARPSGKNVRRLSLLSGGERSLTALAFLFAVFRARPSPFYLLDEVEAALDDVNLHRFLDLVHEFRDEAQLVIVTHQKRTMEAGDVLYGVSMPPGGSTRVVSQRAADVTA